MARYTIYPGTFACHTCKEPVKTLRMYGETKEMTWMCSQKHLTVVSLKTKRKKDYEREE
jgi:hypothetical protein